MSLQKAIFFKRPGKNELRPVIAQSYLKKDDIIIAYTITLNTRKELSFAWTQNTRSPLKSCHMVESETKNRRSLLTRMSSPRGGSALSGATETSTKIDCLYMRPTSLSTGADHGFEPPDKVPRSGGRKNSKTFRNF